MRVLVFEYLSAGGAVTGGTEDDALLEQGLAMRDAMALDLLGVPGVQVDCVGPIDGTAPPGARAVHAALGEGLFDALRRLSAACDAVWAVAPETDGLLQLTQAMVGAPRWIGCDADTLRVAGSKRETLERLGAAGLLTPREFGAAATHWVVKPDDGTSASHTRRHSSEMAARADLHVRLERSLSATIEPWVDGEPLSLSLLCANGEAELLACNRQRITIDGGGHVDFHGVDLDVLPRGDSRRPVLQALGRRVAAAMPGLRGYIGVDLVWHPQLGPIPIEVNPRVTVAYVGLSEQLGRNLAADVLASHRSTLRAAA